MNDFQIGDKFKAFFKHKAKMEVLEGQTYAGKTTVGAIKFCFLVKASKKRQHAICGRDVGTVEKNIINKEFGLLDMFGDDIAYFSNGNARDKLPHIELRANNEIKYIYIFGYADSDKWTKALGGQLGCLLVDEANIANDDFLHEIIMRADYKMLTLNPDNPDLPIYSEYINHCRPLPEYTADTPFEMLNQLESQESYADWVHWYFKMDDNITLTEDKKNEIVRSVPKGSKQYKAKILGLRGRIEGLVFPQFDRDKHVVDITEFQWLGGEKVFRIYNGLDSGLNIDATAVVPICLTTAGRKVILPTMDFRPAKYPQFNSSSKQALIIEKWLDKWFTEFGLNNVWNITCGDSAALTQTVLLEMNERTKYKAMKVGKKDIEADTQRVQGLFEGDEVVIINAGNIDPISYEKIGNNDMLIVELENKVYDKRKPNVPEDGNDHHIDALKYGTYPIYFGGNM